MKLLSIAIPCYNSEAYMEKCIRSLLLGGDEVEIIIVNDGSSDGTAALADKYAKNFPGIVKAVHQENGGHGEAVNAGLRNATGTYFKVVDSDDHVGSEAYKKVLDVLREYSQDTEALDLVISNFVYDKQGAKRKKVMQYRHFMPKDQVFGWDQLRLPKSKYLLMHSLIYRTQLLKDCNLQLPKHTFYVDNIFAFDPLPYVKTMYYIDTNFYRYFIGREDQSVNEQVMIKRIDQQLKVNRLMAETMSEHKGAEKHIRKYMLSYLGIITTISSVMLIRSGTKENLAKKKELFRYLRELDPWVFKKIRFSALGMVENLPGVIGRKAFVLCYKLTQKIYGFN